MAHESVPFPRKLVGAAFVGELTSHRGRVAVRLGCLLSRESEPGSWAEVVLVDRDDAEGARARSIAGAMADVKIVKAEQREGRYDITADIGLPLVIVDHRAWTGFQAHRRLGVPFAMEELSWQGPLVSYLRTLVDQIARQG